MESLDERYLFAQIRLGNRLAFEQLYRLYWRKLYGFAYNTTRSTAQAEDLVQDLFADLWLNRAHWVLPTTVNAYLYTLLRNRILDHIRKQTVRENYIAAIRDANLDTDNTTVDRLQAQELEECIRQQTHLLPTRCREVFELSRFQHYSVEEISHRLNLSPQTVKNHLSKALHILRTQLRDWAISIPLMFLF